MRIDNPSDVVYFIQHGHGGTVRRCFVLCQKGGGGDDMEGGITVFGDYVKKLMVEKRISLRELARRSGMDPANLSRIERGKAYPPQKRENLNKLADAFGLKGEARKQFFELAAHANGIIPENMKHVRGNAAIPLLMRTINKKELNEDQVRELAKMIEQENEWQGRVIE